MGGHDFVSQRSKQIPSRRFYASFKHPQLFASRCLTCSSLSEAVGTFLLRHFKQMYW
jgi:hypothetical protein